MAQIHVYTDDGTKCVLKLTDVDPQALSFLQCPMSAQGREVASSIRRAVQDARVIAQGGNPERLSERAMRLSEWNGKHVEIINASKGYESYVGKRGFVRNTYIAANNAEMCVVDFADRLALQCPLMYVCRVGA